MKLLRLIPLAILSLGLTFAQPPKKADVKAPSAAAKAAVAKAVDPIDINTATADQLKAIPFRSPYRDLATLLKVLTGPGEERATRDKLLERVPADSPFASLARAIRLAQLLDEDLYPALGEASEAARDFVMTLRGWPERRRQIWRELRRLGDHPNISQWLTLLRRYRALLGEPWLRHATTLPPRGSAATADANGPAPPAPAWPATSPESAVPPADVAALAVIHAPPTSM